MTIQPSERLAKSALRARMAACRDALTEPARAQGAAQVATRADEVLARLPAGAIVALYCAKGSELSLIEVDALARRRELLVAYPRVVRGQPWLDLALATPTDLVAGPFGLREPSERVPVLEAARVAAFFTPGLAFDPHGGRLGWGRGYYDSTFLRAPHALRVGVAFECQVVERVPRAAHDVLMHELLTEAGGRRFGV